MDRNAAGISAAFDLARTRHPTALDNEILPNASEGKLYASSLEVSVTLLRDRNIIVSHLHDTGRHEILLTSMSHDVRDAIKV